MAILGGLAVSCAAGVASSGVTSTAELAQITAGPFFFSLLGGGIWAAVSPDPRALLAPGGGVAELVTAVWAPPRPRNTFPPRPDRRRQHPLRPRLPLGRPLRTVKIPPQEESSQKINTVPDLL
ncbi:hypothetical protein [Saccharothrix sp.]|uniref:hypothetical protein n=1 Tax=Saccharothrix sp. TaxID=1873460 RepID=UPI002811FA73|nr:hypothetical protein [Saccharothrix sp.]